MFAFGLKVDLVSQQNSEERKRPKKAVVTAAHSISLSFSLMGDFCRLDFTDFYYVQCYLETAGS